jgi:hypothetical protein
LKLVARQLSHSLAVLWQPLPQVDEGKEDLGAIKRRGSYPLEGISGLQVLARLSRFFYLRPVRAL